MVFSLEARSDFWGARYALSRQSSLLLATGLVFLLAYVIIFALVVSGITQSADASLEIGLNSATAAWATPLMLAATNYGREYFWISILALLLIFGKNETKVFALELAVLFVAGIAVGEVLKLLYFRDRPFVTLGNQINLLVPTDPDSSFPSGHALIVGIGAFFSLTRIKIKVFAALLIIESAIVCYSRLYVGAHYPTDVLGGLAIAGAITFVGLYLLEGPLSKYFKHISGYFVAIMGKIKSPQIL